MPLTFVKNFFNATAARQIRVISILPCVSLRCCIMKNQIWLFVILLEAKRHRRWLWGRRLLPVRLRWALPAMGATRNGRLPACLDKFPLSTRNTQHRSGGK